MRNKKIRLPEGASKILEAMQQSQQVAKDMLPFIQALAETDPVAADFMKFLRKKIKP